MIINSFYFILCVGLFFCLSKLLFGRNNLNQRAHLTVPHKLDLQRGVQMVGLTLPLLIPLSLTQERELL